MGRHIDKHTAEYYLWGNKSETWILADTEGLSVKQESMPAGTKQKMHFHNHAQQFFFILKGTATFYLDKEKEVVGAQKGLLIAPQTNHFIANESSSKLEFLVISQPSTNNDRVAP